LNRGTLGIQQFLNGGGNGKFISQGSQHLPIQFQLFGNDVFDGKIRRSFTSQDSNGHVGGKSTHRVIVGAQAEQRARLGIGRVIGENRDSGLFGEADQEAGRRCGNGIAADPDRLGASGKEGSGRLRHFRRIADGGLNEFNAQFTAAWPGLAHTGFGTLLSGIPDHADALDRGIHLVQQGKGAAHRLKGADSRHVRRMLMRLLARDPHPGAVGIGDPTEHMVLLGRYIGFGERLQGRSASSYDHIHLRSDNFSGNGIGGGEIALRIVEPQIPPSRRHHAFRLQPVQHPGYDCI